MMKRFGLTMAFLFVLLSIYAQESSIVFTENQKQWPSNVLFRSQLHKGNLFLEKNCFTYYFFDEKNSKSRHGAYCISEEELKQSLEQFEKTGQQPTRKQQHKPDSFRAHAYKVSFVNMSSRTKIYGVSQTPYTENYLIGNTPKNWSTGVRSFSKVIYENIYKNTLLQVYGNGTDLKYDFIIQPGGDPQKIKLQYSDVSSMMVRSDGVLQIKTSVNEVYEQKPYAYQIINGDTITVSCSYHLEHFVVSYDLGNYNQAYTLYIDPDLIFSTYTGSTSDNWGFTATYDSENNAYLGGIVEGFGYPVNTGAIQTEYAGGNWDIGIIKLDATGTKRLYATYLGGSSCEMPHSFIVNSKNELLILGTTGSADFPTANAYQKTFAGGDHTLYDNTILFENGVDIFVSRLSPDGTTLLSSTYLGGSKNDGINFSWETDLEYGHDSLYYNYGDGARGEIMIDDDDNVYIASTTFSDDFPIVNGFQSTFGGIQDGIVCKFDPEISTIQWSSYIGGDSKDASYSIDIDHDNGAYVTGGTCSSTLNMPANGYQPNRIGGTVDAYILKIDRTSGELIGGTYFGSTEYDQAHFVRVNSNNKVFIFGQTTAKGNTLIYNAKYNNPNSGQFLASFSNDLTTLHWSTVFGSGLGRPNISPTAFEVDICNRIYLAGVGRDWNDQPNWYFYGNTGYRLYDYGWESIQGTKGMDVTDDAYQKETDGKDFYIMVIDDEANNLDYATFFGELADGYVLYNPFNGQYLYNGCASSGRDHVDGGTSRFDANGYVYQSVCASCGGCNGFPIYPKPGAWSTKNNASNCNSAILRFVIDFGLIKANFDLPEVGCASKELTFKNTSEVHYNNPKLTFYWDFGDGTTSTEESPSHTYTSNGKYTITLWVKDSTSCNQSDSVTKVLSIVTKTNYEILETKNICLGDSVEIGIPNEYDESLEYSWSPTDWITDPSQPSSHTTPNDTTTYQLSVTSGWCQTIYEQTVNTFNEDYFVKNIVAEKNGIPQKPYVCKGETIKLTVETNAPSQRFLWATDKDFKNIINPDFSLDYIEFTPTETGTIYVKTLSTYCEFEAMDSITIYVFYNKIAVRGDTLICGGDLTPIFVENLTPNNPLTYLWSPKNKIYDGYDSDSPIVKPDKKTDFIVYATDSAGCSYTDTVHVDVDELLVNIENFQPISCHGDSDAQFEIVPIGVSPYQVTWDDNTSFLSKYNVGPGTYTVLVSDNLGCTNKTTIEVTDPKELRIDSTIYTHETCKGACNGTISLKVFGGTEPYSYLWNTNDKTANLQRLCPGEYSATVTDAHGCTTTLSEPIQIVLEEKIPDVDAYAESNLVFIGQETTIHATKNPQENITYLWTPNIWLDDNTKAVATVTPDIPLELTFKIIAIDEYGCQNTDTIQLTSVEWICDKPFIFVPTAFTPNNDGKNDVISVNSRVITDMHFTIYDRWGEMVFEANDTNSTWDGTYHGKLLQPQVLVYHLQATCLNGEKFEEKGNITLIR